MDEAELARYRKDQEAYEKERLANANQYALEYRMQKVQRLSGPEYRAERRRMMDEESKRRLRESTHEYNMTLVQIAIAVTVVALLILVVVVHGIAWLT